MKTILALLSITLSAVGCTTREIADAASSASVTAALPVVVTGYGSAYLGKAGYQNSAISLGLPDVLYANEIQALPVPEISDCSFVDTYRYMGSKGEYHYIMHYPTLGLRHILKISKDDFAVKDEFPLTSLSSTWRHLDLTPKYDFSDENGVMFGSSGESVGG